MLLAALLTNWVREGVALGGAGRGPIVHSARPHGRGWLIKVVRREANITGYAADVD
jgi:hypothetical protein